MKKYNYSEQMVRALLWYEVGERAYQGAKHAHEKSDGQTRRDKLEVFNEILQEAYGRVQRTAKARPDSMNAEHKAKELLGKLADIEQWISQAEGKVA